MLKIRTFVYTDKHLYGTEYQFSWIRWIERMKKQKEDEEKK